MASECPNGSRSPETAKVLDLGKYSKGSATCPCFAAGTLIATVRGEVPVEDLVQDDMVVTRDNGLLPIAWVGRKKLGPQQLHSNPHLEPILIKKGSLGNEIPERDLMVSPNHRILTANNQSFVSYKDEEVLVAARHLIRPKSGVEQAEVIDIAYHHFMFESHQVVLANGVWTESFNPDDKSLGGLGNAQRSEIFQLFPALKASDEGDPTETARPVVDERRPAPY